MDFGGLVDNLLSNGIDAWKDIEVSKNYSANNPSPATRDAYGNSIDQGEYAGTGITAVLANNPLVLPVALLVVGIVLFAVLKK